MPQGSGWDRTKHWGLGAKSPDRLGKTALPNPGAFSRTHCLADAKTRLNEFVGLSTSGTLLALLGMLIGIVRGRQESPQLVLKVGPLYPAFPCGEDLPALSAEQRAAAPITLSVPGNLRNPVIAIASRRGKSNHEQILCKLGRWKAALVANGC